MNVNYRYTADEVRYIFDNSDAAVIVYGRNSPASSLQLAPG